MSRFTFITIPTVLYTDTKAGWVDGCRFVGVLLSAAGVAVTGQQARDDDDIGAEVDTQRQHARTPVHVLVLTGQNATEHVQRHRLKRLPVVVAQQGCNQGDYKGIYTPKNST